MIIQLFDRNKTIFSRYWKSCFSRDFFDVDHFKIFTEFVTILPRFMFWFSGHEACGMESTPPALEGEVITTGPPGKSLKTLFCRWGLEALREGAHLPGNRELRAGRMQTFSIPLTPHRSKGRGTIWGPGFRKGGGWYWGDPELKERARWETMTSLLFQSGAWGVMRRVQNSASSHLYEKCWKGARPF